MKTSKKLISIIVAVALLISTIAAVTTLTSSADTVKVSVWDGTWGKIEGGWADRTSTATITNNADGSVQVVMPEGVSGQQYQYQIKASGLDKDKIAAAGNKLMADFTLNGYTNTTDPIVMGGGAFSGKYGGETNYLTVGKTYTAEIDMTDFDYTNDYTAFVMQSKSWVAMKDVDVTVFLYVEEEATDETTTAAAVETTTATPTAETTTGDSSNLVKKAFYNFKPANIGDTHKTEGWIAESSYWGPTASLELSCQKDGSVYYSTAEDLIAKYAQINTDWKNVPSVEGKEVFLDFTNNLEIPVKVKLQYADDNTTLVEAGKTVTLQVKKTGDNGVLNIMIQHQNGWTEVPVMEKSFQISALYTLEPGDPNTTAPETEPETEPEPETTTKKVDGDSFTAGSVFSKYADHHYSKSEGWYSGASNLGDLSPYIKVDPKGEFTLNVPSDANMSSQQVYAWYQLNGSEKNRATKAVEEAKAGTGYIMFDVTVNEAKDKNGNDATVGFKYTQLAGKSLDDSTVVTLPTGKTVRILVDVTDCDPSFFGDATTEKGWHYQMYFKNTSWENGLSVLNVSMTPITVAVDPDAEPETTAKPETTVPETDPETDPETTVPETDPETTTEEVVVEKTNPVSDADFVLVDENTPDDAFVVALDYAWGEVGDVIDYSAYVYNNPGLFAGTLNIKYDSDVLRPVLVDMGSDMVVDGVAGEVLPSVTFGPATPVVDDEGNDLGYAVTSFIMESTGMTDSKVDGVLFTIKFEIIAEPAYGDTTNVVFVNAEDTLFSNLEGVLEPVFAEGAVTVESEEPETETPDVTTETPDVTTETPDITTEEPTTEEPTTEVVKPELVTEAEFAPFDADKFNIVVDEVAGKAGETVDVNITINNNPGIWSGAIYLAYDPAVVNPVEIDDPDGNPWTVVEYKNIMTGVDVTNGFVTDYVVDDYTFKMIPVVFANGAMKNFSENGVLATVTFKIADDAKADDFSNIVFVNFAESKVNNSASQLIEFTVKEGKVTVLGEPTEPETTTGSDVPVVPATTTAKADVETPDATTVAPATTAANAGNGGSSTPNDDVDTGAAAAPFAALALAAGAAFVAFKARKK